MSELILTLEPEFGLSESISFRTLMTEMEDGLERRRAKWSYGLRSYSLRLYAITDTAMNSIWDFFIARKGAYDPFLMKVPTEYIITLEAIGIGNGVALDFILDEFPIDTSANFQLYLNGSPAAATLHNNFSGEFSYARFSLAPGAGVVITGSYHFYFYVRFVNDAMSRELMAYKLLSSGLEMKEVRWSYYRPRAGNSSLITREVSDSISVAEYRNLSVV